MNKTKSYLFALLLGMLTVFVCLAVADGMLGIEGTIQNYVESSTGEITYELHVRDARGRIIFWGGLLILPMLFAPKVLPQRTWINLPLFAGSWYVLSAVFGSHANHRFLAHPARGFISFYEELDPFILAVFLWLVQLVILIAARAVIKVCLRRISAEKKQIRP